MSSKKIIKLSGPNDKSSDQININSSEEDLQNYFHSIHSFIRNKFGLYGKAALQFFNFFFVLKVMEPLIDKKIIKFDSLDETDLEYVDCKYSNINKLDTEDDKIQRVQDIKKKIYYSEHQKTFFMNFSNDIFTTKNCSLTEFIKKLDQLKPEIMDKHHVYGRVYEYFLGHITGRNKGSRSGSQMEDLGQ